MNVIDQIVGFFNPKAGLQRQRYRMATEMLRGFEAASRGRRLGNWKAGGQSANEENKGSIKVLRERSRDLYRNNPYARRAIEGLANNLVGTGIRPAPIDVTDANDRRIKRLWRAWANKVKCDFDGKNNFYGLQWLAAKTMFESGEVLIVRRRSNDKSLPLPFQLQVLEADYIDTAKDRLPLPNGGEIKQGIEYDGSGRITAYWLFDRHPGDAWHTTAKRVPAADVLHIYPVERPGQIRGIPAGTASMVRVKDFDEYEDAQLIKQKISACLSVVLTADGDGTVTGEAGTTMEDFERIEPGMIYKAKPGQEVSVVNPPTVDNYDVYTRTILRAVASGYGVTYEMMTGDLSNVNFSSGRMGWIEFHRLVTRLQELVVVPQMCDPIWDWFMDAAVLSMALRPTQTAEATWTCPRREMIDPVKETTAQVEGIKGALTSWSETVRMNGYDPDEVFDEIKKDHDRFKKAGLVVSSIGAEAAPAANEPPNNGDGGQT